MRDYIKRLVAIWLLCGYSLAQADAYSPFYNRLSKPQDTGLSQEKVQVLAFFSYGCSSCEAVGSPLASWLADKPANVVFQNVASPRGSNGEALSLAYYAADQLKAADTLHPALFKAIHQDGYRFRDNESVVEFIADTLGKDNFSVELAMDSISARSGMLYARQLTQQYQVVNLPAFVINGKYIVHSRIAPTPEKMIKVLNHLVSLELKK